MISDTVNIGSRLIIGEEKCTVKYIGSVPEKTGIWFGVEWDEWTRGKNDGIGLFSPAVPGAASFIKLNKLDDGRLVSSKKPVITGRAFLESVKEKYIGEAPATQVQLGNSNGVVVKTYGWDKMQKRLSNLENLRELGLANMNIAYGEGSDIIANALPLVEDIDLSRNLISNLTSVADICCNLSNLRILRLNYCRFSSPFLVSRNADSCLKQVSILTLVSTLLSWTDIVSAHISFPSLQELHIGHNRISRLDTVPKFSFLRVVDLEYNEIEDWKDVEVLGKLLFLVNLNLSNNKINAIDYKSESFQNLVTLNISNNLLSKWRDIDQLNKFPLLSKLRLVGNPVLENVAQENVHVFLTARLAKAVRVNGSHVSSSDRRDAECYYLSQAHLDKHLENFKELHPRYDYLCAIHGNPTSKKADQTIADGLLEITFLDSKGNSAYKKLSKRMTLRMVKTVVAKSLWPNNWQNAVRGSLLLIKEGVVEELNGDGKTLEYLEVQSGSSLTLDYK